MIASIEFFQGGGLSPIETSPLICKENQWTCLYMIESSIMKELNDGYNL